MPSSPPNFYADELETALKEQSFGIGDFTITATEPIQCSASVTLLEGRTIVITLRNAGYSIETDETEMIYETIEDLLRSASPLFEQKRQEALINALGRIG